RRHRGQTERRGSRTQRGRSFDRDSEPHRVCASRRDSVAMERGDVNAETLNIVVSIATLIVVAVASVAAIVQLRHLRASNQLSGLLEIMNQWNDPAVQRALEELRKIPEKMSDPQYVQMLRGSGAQNRAAHAEFLAMDLWEQIGTFSRHGLIDENILLD